MDFEALNYSLTTLVIVAVVSFLLGRWSASGNHARRSKPIGEVREPPTYGKKRSSAKPDTAALSAEAEREIERLLAKGRLIAAIKVARRELGIGLKDAKQFIDQRRHRR